LDLFRTISHLLPRGPAWKLTPSSRGGSLKGAKIKSITQFFSAIADSFNPLLDFFGGVWLDMFPAHTTQLTSWESQLGMLPANITEAQQRARIDGRWKERGGQSPAYLQSVLQAAGFPLYVHDWWEPGTYPPIARNPLVAVGGDYPQFGDGTQFGDDDLQFGAEAATGYALANKLYTARTNWDHQFGDDLQFGDDVQFGENSGVIYERILDRIPEDPKYWPRLAYVGGETFPEFVFIQSALRDDLENLVLRIFPADVWIVMLVQYTEGYYVDENLNYLVDENGNRLVALYF
jgi:hypothetical protein